MGEGEGEELDALDALDDQARTIVEVAVGGFFEVTRNVEQSAGMPF